MKISKIAFQIIELLVKERKECYLREIAKKRDISTSSVSRQLKLLKGYKILNERKLGKELLYSLNLKNNTTLKLCELIETQRLENFYTRNKELKIILTDFLEQIKNKELVNVTVFGSVAKDTYVKESDIDILIITYKKIDFAKQIRKIHAEYGKNVSVVNLTKEEIKKKKSELLIKEIIKSHLILYGYEFFIQEVYTNEKT